MLWSSAMLWRRAVYAWTNRGSDGHLPSELLQQSYELYGKILAIAASGCFFVPGLASVSIAYELQELPMYVCDFLIRWAIASLALLVGRKWLLIVPPSQGLLNVVVLCVHTSLCAMTLLSNLPSVAEQHGQLEVHEQSELAGVVGVFYGWPLEFVSAEI